MKFIDKLISYFYSASELPKDPLFLRRLYVIAFGAFFEVITNALNAGLTFVRKQYFHSVVFFIFTLMFFLVLVAVRKAKTLYVPSVIFCCTIFFFIYFELFCLVEVAHLVLFCVWIPVFYATFLINSKTGILFAILSAVSVILIEMVRHSGYVFPYAHHLPEQMMMSSFTISVIANFFFLAFSAWYFEGTREKTENKLKASSMALLNTQDELAKTAHQAGMSEIATGTLHNIGNILNSIKTSAYVIKEIKNNSVLSDLKRANELLKKNMDALESFVLENPKGVKLMAYYMKIEEGINKEEGSIQQHVSRLVTMIDTITGIIAAQQGYGSKNGEAQETVLSDVMEDALTMQAGTIERYKIKIVKDFNNTPGIPAHKTMLLHILINLIRNARDAMLRTPINERKLDLKIESDEQATYIKVRDTGHGITEDNKRKIFSHGFTTKEGGHGFGLHSCVSYMNEMGGSILADSEGQDKGATFILKFPYLKTGSDTN